MDRWWGVLFVGALLAPFPAAGAQTAAPDGGKLDKERALVRHETRLDKACAADVMADCSALSDPRGGSDRGIAAAACASFNATMTRFCEMVGDHEPDSPEMLAATAKVIAAKKHLLKQLGQRS